MSEVSIDSILDESSEQIIVIPVKGLSLDVPHWRVKREDLLQTLGVVNCFLSASTLLVSILLEKSESGFCLRINSTNKDYYFSRTIPVQNKSNLAVTYKLYFVKLGVLTTLAKSYEDFAFTFTEDFSKLSFYNPYITYQFDTFNLDGFNFNPNDVSGSFSPLRLNTTMLNSIKKMFGFTLRTSDNKVSCVGPSMFGSFMIYSFIFSQQGTFEFPFTLRKVDVESLLHVIPFAGELFYYVSGGRVFITWSSGYISFLTIEPKIEYFNVIRGDKIGSMSLDRETLKRALAVASALGVSTVTFSLENSDVVMKSESVKGISKTSFVVGSGELQDSISFSLDTLRKDVFSIASVTPVLDVAVYDAGIVFNFIDELDAYSYSLSKLTVGSVERKQKIENKIEKREEYTERLKASGEFKKNIELGEAQSLEDILKKK